MKEIIGENILIIGYGREGKSVHSYLHKNYPEKKVSVADKSHVIPLYPVSELICCDNYLTKIHSFDLIIRSPGIFLNDPEIQKYIQDNKTMTSGTNIFFSECKGMIIGVTGTKGKSTTTSLVAAILSKKYKDVRIVGNIGKPALDYLEDSTEKTIFVMELSSQQLADCRYSPHISILLKIAPEHLNFHNDFKNYILAKSNIFKHQKERDILIINPDYFNKNLLFNVLSQKFYFSIVKKDDSLCFIDNNTIFIKQNNEIKEIMKTSEIPLLGKGNQENVCAALTVGPILNVDIQDMKKAIQSFKALPHRLENIGTVKGITFYDAALSTIPEAVINAIDALDNKVTTLLAGGFDRGLDFSILGPYLLKSNVKTLILFPTTGEKIWQAIVNAAERPKGQALSVGKNRSLPKKFNVTSMEEAVDVAFRETPSGTICLMAPGSPSFGLFKDYDEKGNLFKKFVLARK